MYNRIKKIAVPNKESIDDFVEIGLFGVLRLEL